MVIHLRKDPSSGQKSSDVRDFDRSSNNKLNKQDSQAALELLRRLEVRLEQKEKELAEKETVLEEREKELTQTLEKTSGMTREEAKNRMLKLVERGIQREIGRRISQAEEKADLQAETKAKDILVSAMEHAATNYVAEYTTSRIEIPSDEIKGKIIGREGRNIRALERVTGVDFILDDEGEVRISSFDPVRREIAKIALTNLIKDGRIQPAYIEQEVERVKNEMEKVIVREGERIVMEAGVPGLPRALIEIIGRFKFRTSYGQNLAKHSIEMAKLASYIAAEVGADVDLCKKAALLHDLGKVHTGESDVGHAVMTRRMLERFGMPEKLINAAASHHEDETRNSVEAEIVYIADAISGSRPGARYEDFEGYVSRIKELEEAAASFPGVVEAYAISAGREVRVIVEPKEVDDEATAKLAHDISKKIHEDLSYPGIVKVVVIRELRAEAEVK